MRVTQDSFLQISGLGEEPERRTGLSVGFPKQKLRITRMWRRGTPGSWSRAAATFEAAEVPGGTEGVVVVGRGGGVRCLLLVPLASGL